MCELKEARSSAPKLRHGVRCSTLVYCMCMPNVQQMSATVTASGLVQLQPQQMSPLACCMNVKDTIHKEKTCSVI